MDGLCVWSIAFFIVARQPSQTCFALIIIENHRLATVAAMSDITGNFWDRKLRKSSYNVMDHPQKCAGLSRAE